MQRVTLTFGMHAWQHRQRCRRILSAAETRPSQIALNLMEVQTRVIF